MPISEALKQLSEAERDSLLVEVQNPADHAAGATIAELHGWFGDAIIWLAGLHALGVSNYPVELAVLMAANLAATVTRFLLLRGLVFHPGRNAVAASEDGPA